MTSAQAQTNYQRILSFGPSADDGSSPRGLLLEADDGWLYGTTSGGGSNFFGTVFKISKSGGGFAVIHSFDDGHSPWAGLTEASDGSLCGTTSTGGSYPGTVFKLNKDGSGYLLLHTFNSTNGDGAQPMAGLTSLSGGVLYGTTFAGGTASLGTIFSITTGGSGYTVRHSFTGSGGGADGASPGARLCLGRDGALYGTTEAGGSNNLGTVFKIKPDGTGYTILHHFSGPGQDGRLPYGELVQGSDGLLYGTTYYGGTNDSGTVFCLATNGQAYAVRLSFAAGSLGYEPYGGLVQRAGGRLYGTTRYGGSRDSGTVFGVSTNGGNYEVLHSFSGTGGDGSQPLAGLWLGTDGGLYGSTYWGGDYTANGVNGTLFRMLDSDPVLAITVLGSNPVTNAFSVPYADPGAEVSNPGSGLVSFITNCTVNVNVAGNYTVQYVATDVGGDCITNTRAVVVQQPVVPVIVSESVAAGRFQLGFSGPNGQSFHVLASTNLSLPLSSWTVLTNGTFSGTASFIDTTAGTIPVRFYRIRSP